MKFALIADFICVNYRNSRLIFRLRKDVKMPQAGLKFLAISIRAENGSKNNAALFNIRKHDIYRA
nr:MAG TPA: hypothetical protein [Caudoviricetes sp.]